MIYCWSAQLRSVSLFLGEARVRPIRSTQDHIGPPPGVFAYVEPAVREAQCPPSVVERFRGLGYTVVRIEPGRAP